MSCILNIAQVPYGIAVLEQNPCRIPPTLAYLIITQFEQFKLCTGAEQLSRSAAEVDWPGQMWTWRHRNVDHELTMMHDSPWTDGKLTQKNPPPKTKNTIPNRSPSEVNVNNVNPPDALIGNINVTMVKQRSKAFQPNWLRIYLRLELIKVKYWICKLYDADATEETVKKTQRERKETIQIKTGGA